MSRSCVRSRARVQHSSTRPSISLLSTHLLVVSFVSNTTPGLIQKCSFVRLIESSSTPVERGELSETDYVVKAFEYWMNRKDNTVLQKIRSNLGHAIDGKNGDECFDNLLDGYKDLQVARLAHQNTTETRGYCLLARPKHGPGMTAVAEISPRAARWVRCDCSQRPRPQRRRKCSSRPCMIFSIASCPRR